MVTKHQVSEGNMTTSLKVALELREWQKKFNPSQPVQPVSVVIKKQRNDGSAKYLSSTFFSK